MHKHANSKRDIAVPTTLLAGIHWHSAGQEETEGPTGRVLRLTRRTWGYQSFYQNTEDLPHWKHHMHIGYNPKGRTRASGWKLCGVTCFHTGMTIPPF